jgi:lambda family phage tail tape measure protein
MTSDPQELGDVALNVLDKIVSKLQDEMVDALFATSGSGSGGFLGSLFGGIGSLFGGGGSSFPAAPGSGLWADGGYTGDGGKYEEAGTVHKGEFVFTKQATQRVGPKALYALMNYLEKGSLSSFSMAGSTGGYADGGYVSTSSSPALPSMSSPGLSSMAGVVRDSQPVSSNPGVVEVHVSGARGNSEIMEMISSGLHQGFKAYDRKLPYRIKEINKNPDKVK